MNKGLSKKNMFPSEKFFSLKKNFFYIINIYSYQYILNAGDNLLFSLFEEICYCLTT